MFFIMISYAGIATFFDTFLYTSQGIAFFLTVDNFYIYKVHR